MLQILQSGVVKDSVKLATRDFRIKLFKPGEYDMRIVFDENNNFIWDTGEFFGKRKQPERVIAIKRKLSIKANWDNEYNIDL